MNKYMRMSYANYLSMATNKTKNYLMISELIDNSISSFEQKLGEDFNHWPSGELVEIDIEIHSNFRSRNIKKKHRKTYKPESFISVSDNAYGMNEDILFKSIELDNTKIAEGSNKNVHGRGMKQAAFYFGMSLEIETNDSKSSKKLVVDLTKIDDLTSDFERVVVDSSKQERGTKVKISNIYTNRINDSQKFIKDILEPLKTRYWIYLSSGRLVINIKGDDYENLKSLDSAVETPIFMNISCVENFYKDDNLDSKQLRDQVLRKIKNFSFSNNNDGYGNKEYQDIIKENFLKVYSGTDQLKWEYKGLKFGFIDSIQIDISLWRFDKSIISSGFGPYRGIYIVEGGRFIKHGPDHGAYLDWFPPVGHSSGSTDNIFMGIIDITNIDYIIATNDKSDIEMPKDVQDELNDFIYWNWKLFDEIENFRRQPEKQSNSNFDTRNILKSLNSRYTSASALNDPALPYSNDINLLNDKSLEGTFKIHDDNWKIYLYSDENETEISKIITGLKIDRSKKEIMVNFNKNAAMWNQAINLKQTEFYGNVLYPVVIQLCVLFINNNSTSSDNLISSINNKKVKIDVD